MGKGKIVGKEYGRSYCAVSQQGRERRLLRAMLSIDDADLSPEKSVCWERKGSRRGRRNVYDAGGYIAEGNDQRRLLWIEGEHCN